MKYLECKCCGFLAVIPTKEDETKIPCPFCFMVECDEGGFIIVSSDVFIELAQLNTKPQE